MKKILFGLVFFTALTHAQENFWDNRIKEDYQSIRLYISQAQTADFLSKVLPYASEVTFIILWWKGSIDFVPGLIGSWILDRATYAVLHQFCKYKKDQAKTLFKVLITKKITVQGVVVEYTYGDGMDYLLSNEEVVHLAYEAGFTRNQLIDLAEKSGRLSLAVQLRQLN